MKRLMVRSLLFWTALVLALAAVPSRAALTIGSERLPAPSGADNTQTNVWMELARAVRPIGISDMGATFHIEWEYSAVPESRSVGIIAGLGCLVGLIRRTRRQGGWN